MRVLWLLGLLLWIGGWSQSPITRADLAVRLIETETCWESHRESSEARLRATRPLSDGLTAFFSGRLGELARNLTLACAALHSEANPAPELLYAGALGVRMPHVIDKEAMDKGEFVLRFQLFGFYNAEKPQTPLQLRWKVIRRGETRPIREGTLENPEPGAAATLLTQTTEGDYEVHFEIRQGEQILRQWRQTFSVVSRLSARLEALDRAAETHDDADTIERMTVLNARDVLQSAQKGDSPETFYPLLRLLQLAERIAAGWEAGKSAWQPAPGDYWMATLYRERKVAFRLFIPKQFKPNQPIPVVVALHGAGGNEHLFFEGYGLGIVLKEAEKRGWAVIAPRAEIQLAHIGGALEAVQKLLPVAPKRVYLMGHSMGGAHSFAAIAQFPDKFRAVVIFAGAGQPTQVPADLPILMTVGEQEIAMLKNNIENAYRRLQGLNLKTLDYKKYDACDHLMIVREAMPDAFAFFERAPAR
ncbi:MAG: alpha/beta fold hydrolase [Fimbriimonadales bacterium]|nr:alpha/beta fold hydrolase [Fimbriimonadales bacterium]